MPPAASQRETKEGRGQGGERFTRTRGAFTYRGEFKNNLEKLMYAFGDEEKPDSYSVALMEDMVLTFLVDLCHRARPQPHKISIPSNQNTINTIAAGLLSQQEEPLGGGIASDGKLTNNNNKNTTASRGKGKEDRLSPTTTRTTTMPPRLFAHPYVGRPRMTVEDLKFACRKDPKLSTRIEELLYLDKVFTDAQKAFNNPEEDVAEKTS